MAATRSHTPPPDGPTADQIEAFQDATRDLVGLAVRSLATVEDEVSLPQLRLLLALRDSGGGSSVQAARTLGLSASSVTRLADRLAAGGHLVRGTDPGSRSIVTLELTALGRRTADRALRARRRELADALALLDPGERAAAAAALAHLHRILGSREAADRPLPLPL